MTNLLYNMTIKELDIKTVMEKLLLGELTEQEASKRINKSLRQTQRIKRKFKLEGVTGLIHKLRNKTSNHKYDTNKYIEAIQIVKDKYNDYGPTLASEKLVEKHNIKISIPILRREMIKYGIWKSKTRKKQDKQYTARERKENYGEMIQYDGSYHYWFEGRDGTQYQCLLVSVDDSTNELKAKFALNEGLTQTFKYIEEKGKPLIIYLDKFATYKVNYPTATDDKELVTQFGRVCNNLGIKLIFANTPQAKGRVERMNKTLQDRLVKELRENNISDIESANKFLKEVLLPKFNKQFMVKPRGTNNLHMPLRQDEIGKLDQIFSEHKERKITNDYTIQFENKYYQLYRKNDCGYMIKPGEKVTIERHLNGDIKISKKGIYIVNKASFDKPEKIGKLYTAPISDEDIENKRKEILENLEKEKIEKQKQKEEQDKNRLTNLQKTGKSHIFVKGLFQKNKIELTTKT